MVCLSLCFICTFCFN
uniref:Uncharacterized protein n=1 Tax=Arundo donax TaxID=35708 RepID=A0A0A9CQI7_ARUDO